MPLRHRHGYAAGIHRGLFDERSKPVGEFPPSNDEGARRCLAQIRQVRASGIHLRGVQTLVSHVHLSVVLAGPDRSDGAATVPALSGLLAALTPVSGLGLPSASPPCCDRLEEKVSHLLSVQERLVALDIGDPEAIRFVALKLPFDEIRGSGLVGHSAETGASRESLQPGAVHEHLDGAMPDVDAETHGELGVDPAGAIDLFGAGMDPGDDVGQPGMPDSPG
jgi:hypothetical protein